MKPQCTLRLLRSLHPISRTEAARHIRTCRQRDDIKPLLVSSPITSMVIVRLDSLSSIHHSKPTIQ